MNKFIDSKQLFIDNPKLYNKFIQYICGRKSIVFDIEYSNLIEIELYVQFINYLKNKK